MSGWRTSIPFFTESELACPCCNVVFLNLNFAAMLCALRVHWGKDFVLNSVCRCPDYNAAIKGHPTSLHLMANPKWPSDGAMAADVAWRNWPPQRRLQFARLAHEMGFRVGLHEGFCHIDWGRTLGVSPRPFTYQGWGNHFEVEEILS